MEQQHLPQKMLCAGAAACTADIISFPLDVAKVRLQISAAATLPLAGIGGGETIVYRGLFGTIFGLIKHEGFRSLYGGIGPGLQRQCVFASIRIGLYDSVKEFYSRQLNQDSPNCSTSTTMLIRIASAITTGAIGISVAQPTDVVKVRMQAAGDAKQYRNSIHAYRTIYLTEGIRGLWKGLGPNIARNSIVNAAELVCYDTAKEAIIARRLLPDGFVCHVAAAFVAGFAATFVSSPIDVVKTNYMNSVSQYRNVFHCAQSLARNGGLLAFYGGSVPSFMRIVTWNICMFVTFEQLKRLTTSSQVGRRGGQEVTASDKIAARTSPPLTPNLPRQKWIL